MKYLLDTCVVSDFIKANPNTVKQIKNTPPIEIAISSITVMEIHYGLALNPKYAKTCQPVILDFLNAITILNFEEEDATQAATICASLKRQGNMIGSYDILLAGMALNRDLILVSANTNEFKRVKGLTLQNWREL